MLAHRRFRGWHLALQCKGVSAIPRNGPVPVIVGRREIERLALPYALDASRECRFCEVCVNDKRGQCTFMRRALMRAPLMSAMRVQPQYQSTVLRHRCGPKANQCDPARKIPRSSSAPGPIRDRAGAAEKNFVSATPHNSHKNQKIHYIFNRLKIGRAWRNLADLLTKTRISLTRFA